ncbi:uncharacterized protein B0I36DRAFT_388065 [Microdochium trichocladiopsis]|uniref:Uncharacterized protein n=1 Tax=Microdochium trichocladiopsis TaxID=1682393 RepID=A0A9P8XWS3_9PEZI|nr:uncharacterized protein B0I36DRAFT_388065 [Microdochium trichocladiopsis]KAH7021336.1 hypothetical protein B0I36DRAFT_388065 [Microdochium trichocladiopsis]
MLPPADQGVLPANPDFAKVYRRLTGSLLNSDASSRDHTQDDKRAAVREELKAHRIEVIKHQILKQAIAQAVPQQDKPSSSSLQQQPTAIPSSRANRSSHQTARVRLTSSENSPSMPQDLVDLLTLLPPFLSTAPSLPAHSLATLLSNPPFTHLQPYFPQITALLSANLSKQASTLAKAVYPTTNPSFIHRHIPSLAITAETLTSTLADGKRQLSHLRISTAHLLAESYLAQHLQGITFLIGLLEAKHGAVSSIAAAEQGGAVAAAGQPQQPQTQVLHAQATALEAQHWSLASRALLAHAVDVVYPADARVALANYKRHLAGARMRVLDASVVKEAELRDYGVMLGGGGAYNDDEDGLSGGGGGGGGMRGNRKRDSIAGGGGGGDETKERTMREIARVYREIEGRMREVRRDLKRLGRI